MKNHERTLNYQGKSLVTVEKLAADTGYCLPHLRRLAAARKIPAIKIGHRWWFDKTAVLTALQQESNAATILDGL